MRFGLGHRALGAAALLLAALFAVSCGAAPASSAQAPAPSVSEATPSSPSSTPEPSPAPPASRAVQAGISPLTGLALAEGTPENQRPVSVMVAGSMRAWPQRGLASAQVLYELPVENDDTLIMALYPNAASVPAVGPVRATRDSFVQLAVPLNSIHVHIGGSPYAENLLNLLAYQDVDGMYVGTTTFLFDAQRTLPKTAGKLNENCWFTDANLLAQGIAFSNVATEGTAESLFRFTKEAWPVKEDAHYIECKITSKKLLSFAYKTELGRYITTQNHQLQADESGTLLMLDNVFLLFCNVGTKTDGYYLQYDLSGGEGLYFAAGGVQDITWKKGGPTDDLLLYGDGGKELEVQPGVSYVAMIPTVLRQELISMSVADIDAMNQAQQAEAEAQQAPPEDAAEPVQDDLPPVE